MSAPFRMSDIAIRVEGLGKRYRIGARRERYRSLRDTIADAARWPIRATQSLFSRNGGNGNEENTFWALKDVSFEVQRGEVVGVIGRNGAGKSTLLKILSRITEPTTGRAEIHGRVGSLLEVGTGFHPELTGRENIYLNGAILGMKKREIDCKFDEIVAFAEVEKFIDTMVKYYSSGMYLRLAFAVAAHLEPEILLVDEVLAVGDAAFQKKCLGKMRDVSREGRTVLFVSHNMAAVQALCPKAILLYQGAVKFGGSSVEAVTMNLSSDRQGTYLQRNARPDGTPTITLLELTRVECTDETKVQFRMQNQGSGAARCSIEVKISDLIGAPIGFASVGLLDPLSALDLRAGCEEFLCGVKLPRMARGIYRLTVQVAKPMVQVLDSASEGICFDLDPRLPSGYQRVLESQWGYGALELPLDIDRAPVESPGKEPTALSLREL